MVFSKAVNRETITETEFEILPGALTVLKKSRETL